MGNECSTDLQNEHSRVLGMLSSDVDNLKVNVERHEQMFNFLTKITNTQTEILMNLQQFAKELAVVAETQEKDQRDIRHIKDNMETKESVARLHGKIEELENSIAKKELDLKDGKLKEFDGIKRFILKIVLGAGVFIGASLIIFAIIILTAMAKSGALPTP